MKLSYLPVLQQPADKNSLCIGAAIATQHMKRWQRACVGAYPLHCLALVTGDMTLVVLKVRQHQMCLNAGQLSDCYRVTADSTAVLLTESHGYLMKKPLT